MLALVAYGLIGSDLYVPETGGPRTLVPEEARIMPSFLVFNDFRVGESPLECLARGDRGNACSEPLGVTNGGVAGEIIGDDKLLEGSSGGGVLAGKSSVDPAIAGEREKNDMELS